MRKPSSRNALFHLPETLRLVWGASRKCTILWGTLLVVQGLLPVVPLYLIRRLVDGLVEAVSASGAWPVMKPLAVMIGLLALTMLLIELVQSVSEGARVAQSELVRDHIASLIHEKSAGVDLAFYESSDYYDHLHRARDDADGRCLALMESVGSLAQNGITLVAMAAVLFPYGYWVPLVLLAGTLPAFLVIFHFDRAYHDWWKRSTADRRWADYYDFMLTHATTAPEIRLFGLGDSFRESYQRLRRNLRGEHIKIVRHRSAGRFAAGAFALLSTGAVMGIMVLRVTKGLATFGDLALFYQAFTRGQNLMRSLLSNLGRIYTNGLFLNNLFEFFNLEPQITDTPKPLRVPRKLKRGIRFRQVTFRYPGSDRKALDGFDLFIPAGQTAAIVGANGAGKSTLVRLLCRFYDPEVGSIEWDGVDVRQMPLQDLRRMVTVLFQIPVPYHATAFRNIALGDVAAEDDPAEVETAARFAGAHEIVSRLPHGYQTLLGKWFADGTDLSAGEWQRIALARAFYRRAQIVVLDEPTSFMDSWAEKEWYDRFQTLVQGRTALLITHRFTLARRADIIHVMSDGRIIESGTHEQLLARKGLYAEAWGAQWGHDKLTSSVVAEA